MDKEINNKIKIQKKQKLLNKVNDTINNSINPNLRQHEGYITLIDINNNMEAIVKFNGGCKSCPMTTITLKNYIEKQLLSKFKKLTKVIEIK